MTVADPGESYVITNLATFAALICDDVGCGGGVVSDTTADTTRAWPWLEVPNDEMRAVRFRKAFHRCNPSLSKNYGIGSVRMLWVLKVDDWAMTWDVSTDWGLPAGAFHAANPACDHPRHQRGYPSMGEPSGGAVDWHSPAQRWEGQSLAQEHCVVTGSPCYLDSGFLLGSELLDLLRTEGDEAVWLRLRELLDEAMAEAAS